MVVPAPAAPRAYPPLVAPVAAPAPIAPSVVTAPVAPTLVAPTAQAVAPTSRVPAPAYVPMSRSRADAPPRASDRPAVTALLPAAPAAAADIPDPINTLDGGQVIGRMVSGKRRNDVATCLYGYLGDFSNGPTSAKDTVPGGTAGQIDIGMMAPRGRQGFFGTNEGSSPSPSYRVSLFDRDTGTAITIQQGPHAFTPLPRQMLMDIVMACSNGK